MELPKEPEATLKLLSNEGFYVGHHQPIARSSRNGLCLLSETIIANKLRPVAVK